MDVGDARQGAVRRVGARVAGAIAIASVVCGELLVAPVVGQSTTGTTAGQPGWTLVYAEDFSTPFNGAVAPWIWDGASEPFDTIMDDAGLWYENDYGPA
jgi:hypothetical protein